MNRAPSMGSVLSVLREQGGLDPLAHRLGATVGSLASAEDRPIVELSVALLVVERARGHSCALLEEWGDEVFPLEGQEVEVRLPRVDQWTEVLRRSGLAGDGSRPLPMVLDPSGRLYLYRYWAAERRLAAGLRQHLLAADPSGDEVGHGGVSDDGTSEGNTSDGGTSEGGASMGRPADLERAGGAVKEEFAQVFDALFGPESGELPAADEEQAQAARAVLRRRVALVTGGPGTGKTTTVVRILGLLLAREPGLRIALAAPTGKAAARLSSSIHEQRDRLPLPEPLRARIPEEVHTLHRLLGYEPYRERYHHDREHPLPYDAVVVDEASMVDLLLMDALVMALPRSARLVLIGDKDQLASVEAGYVLGEICNAASAPGSIWREAMVELRNNHRFQQQPGIATLASAIRDADATTALEVLDDPSLGDALREELPANPLALLRPLHSMLDAFVDCTRVEEAFALLRQSRILCALRRGAFGVAGMNRGVESELRRRGLDTSEPFYRGRPLLITRNDPELSLFNGDLGLCWPDPESGALRAWFGSPSGLRPVTPAQLPDHETAWAMTVHKSQGSEFDQVLLVLPPFDLPLISRELLYTAVTRARRRVFLFADAVQVEAAIARTSLRHSALSLRLLEAG